MDQIAEPSRTVRAGRVARSPAPTSPPGKKGRGPTLIGSVQRALRLLEAVGGFRQGATAKQLARAAGLPLGTAYHLLRTLTHEGYLRRVDGRFVYGESVDGIGRAEGRQTDRYDLRARMQRLRDDVGAAVYFALYRDGEIHVVDIVDDPGRPAVEPWADLRATAHAHAIGQCLLGQLPEEERRDHLARHPPTGLTPSTLTSGAAVLRRLASLRPTMPVLERQEYALGTVCAAVPITIGPVVATIALSLPVEQADRLTVAAGQLRRSVGAMSPSFVL
ncbi:helix-turn-helix domain-containing protein [Kitasatospora sp. MAA19]|uniref:IclR family transcriptional regulator n=1 Tax=Kitasatospora sp. MAA19 TaxID=3035090 RepID=UPI002476BC48|nr:helix-turn-helix domain-containing protein [Kitasatospora sp. MAA19]